MPGSLNVTRARIHQQNAPGGQNGSIRVDGDFLTPPTFGFPPSITVRVQDSLTLDQSHTFASCTSSGGRVRCKDSIGVLSKASFQPLRSTPSVYRFKIRLLRLGINGPFAGPVQVTLTHNAGTQRMDSIADCRAQNSGLSCRGF